MPDSPLKEPKVSILMTTYNHEKYIAQAIESVLMQETNFPYELLVGEDCSTDGTRAIVREYSDKHPEIVHAFFRESNLGSRQNVRQLFWASRGQYIALLEGDDYWISRQKLQTQANLLDAHPETTLCGHRSVWRWEDGSQPDRIPGLLAEGFYELEDILRYLPFHTGTAMFRRVIEDFRPDRYKHLVMGDYPLFVELALRGNIYVFAEAMGAYRIHAGGTWAAMDPLRRERESRALFLTLYDRLGEKYRPLVRYKVFECSYNLGLASFTAGQPGLTRESLNACLRYSGAFQFIPQKLRLACMGYCGWPLVAWRRFRRALRPSAGSRTRG
jgi:glycosyltransferase involved in cell wall biosynthesis